MTEDIESPETPDENEEESFAELFEAYGSGMSDNIEVGDKISGKVLSIGSTHVFVDTGTKIDGVVEKAELLGEDGELPFAEGDTLDLYVVSMNESELKLSKAVSGIGGLNMLKEAFASQIPIEGKVQKGIKGGLQVEVMQRRAFCPISQIDVKYVENADEYVGNTYHFLIKRFEEKGRNIVLSRREILEKEQQEVQKAFLETLSVDSVVDGTVTRTMPYGAFVELTPGLEGMVHISELSWSRVEKPEEAVGPGDKVRVKVLKIEDGKKANEKRIGLSIKQALGDPWDTITDSFHTGDRVKGKVTRLMGFGAFVEISPGVEGLVHISEMSYVKRVHRPDDVVTAGEMVWVMIKEVDRQNRRISLSIKEAEGDPWADVEEKYPLGKSVSGVFEKKEKFGCFIALEPGVVGLLPKSKLSQSASASAIENMKKGESITVIVDEIQTENRKISLNITDATDEGEWKTYSAGSGNGMGSLGEKLQQALKNTPKK